MIPENPAVRLYNQWHTIMEYQGREFIEGGQERARSYLDIINDAKPGSPWSERASYIEEQTLDYMTGWNSMPQVMLDYRMGLRIVGMSDRHIAEENRLWNDVSDWKPIIQLILKYRYSRCLVMMTLWPNGDFRMDNVPASGFYQIFPRWTFFKTSWTASSRVWFPEQPGQKPYRSGWVREVDGKDFHTAIPFVGRNAFIAGGHYRVVWDGKFWRFASQYGCDDGNYDLDKDHKAKTLLQSEYDRCERRYERYRQASVSSPSEQRVRKLVMYVPKHGRMTGLEAVQEFQQHMRVYEPTKAHEEATNGSDSLVASTVHQ